MFDFDHLYMLSPTDFGIPNERLRYYCLAKRKPLAFKSFGESDTANADSQVLTRIPGSKIYKQQIKTIGEYLEKAGNSTDIDWKHETDEYKLPSKFYKTFGYRFDMVTSDMNHSTCFTKGYGKNFKGSGPILLRQNSSARGDTLTTATNSESKVNDKRKLGDISAGEFPEYTSEELQQLDLRLFTPSMLPTQHHYLSCAVLIFF